MVDGNEQICEHKLGIIINVTFGICPRSRKHQSRYLCVAYRKHGIDKKNCRSCQTAEVKQSKIMEVFGLSLSLSFEMFLYINMFDIYSKGPGGQVSAQATSGVAVFTLRLSPQIAHKGIPEHNSSLSVQSHQLVLWSWWGRKAVWTEDQAGEECCGKVCESTSGMKWSEAREAAHWQEGAFSAKEQVSVFPINGSAVELQQPHGTCVC